MFVNTSYISVGTTLSEAAVKEFTNLISVALVPNFKLRKEVEVFGLYIYLLNFEFLPQMRDATSEGGTHLYLPRLR